MIYYVYILQSESIEDKYYTGFTTDIRKRLVKHNNGEVPHTSKYKPWKIKNVISFTDKTKALAFEKYLKATQGVHLQANIFSPIPSFSTLTLNSDSRTIHYKFYIKSDR